MGIAAQDAFPCKPMTWSFGPITRREIGGSQTVSATKSATPTTKQNDQVIAEVYIGIAWHVLQGERNQITAAHNMHGLYIDPYGNQPHLGSAHGVADVDGSLLSMVQRPSKEPKLSLYMTHGMVEKSHTGCLRPDTLWRLKRSLGPTLPHDNFL